MKKKISIISILAVLMLVTISFAAAVSSEKRTGEKESPLYRIRTSKALGEKLANILENIRTKFLGERIFYSFIFLGKWVHNGRIMYTQGKLCTVSCVPTCPELCTSKCWAGSMPQTYTKPCLTQLDNCVGI